MFCAPCLTDVANEDWLTHLVIEHIDKMEKRIMTAIGNVQEQINTIGDQLTDLGTSLATDASTIEASQATTVDLTKLNSGLSAVQTAAAALSALANPPAPAPVVDVPPAE